MRLTSQRGVSLLVLVIMVTVFAGVAIGFVTLLRSRHESYPYQVQSYQAYALAHAGAEFAIRYAKDNQSGLISNTTTYFPVTGYKDFTFGNGTFSLRYVPGCPDKLYSRGTCGTATREVELSNLGILSGSGNSVYMSSVPTRIPYTSAGIYSGDRIEFTFCDPSRFALGEWSWVNLNSITIAATQPISIMRVGPSTMSGASYQWVWDGACDGGSMNLCQATALGVWDGISNPPNASFTPTWNVWNPLDLVYDMRCRPRACPVDDTTYPTDPGGCWIYPGTSRTIAVCGTILQRTTNMRPLSFGDWQGHVAIETRGSIPLPTTFYVAFDHGIAGYNTWPGRAPNPNPWIRNTFIFTIDH
jgi:hypothetical protein